MTAAVSGSLATPGQAAVTERDSLVNTKDGVVCCLAVNKEVVTRVLNHVDQVTAVSLVTPSV